MSEDCQKEDHNYVYPNPGWGVTIYGYKPENCSYCEIDRLTAELSRYKQGVEVEVTVDSYDYGDTSFICEDIKLPSEFRGQRVRVLVMKVSSKE